MLIGRRGAVGLAVAGLSRPALAQGWPARPVRFIVPYGAGNQADQVARVLADGLSARWGQRLVVDNQSGAGGGIGVAMIARAAPDGYTLGFIAIAALAITPHLQPTPYDPLNDFTGVAAVSVSRAAIVVNAALPVRTVPDLVAHARSRPNDPLFFYSPGTGTIPHLNGELFRKTLDFPATHVPYRTAAAGVTDLVAGRVHFGLDGLTVTLPQIEAGKLRALAAISPNRLPLIPNVPAMPEVLPGLDLPSAWQSVQAPRGFPEEIAAKVAADTAALLADPDFARRMPQGSDPFPMSRAEVAQRIRAEHARFGAAVRDLGLATG
jgi:tripartite-type tricarboxylate transporter receptor subunit TctC